MTPLGPGEGLDAADLGPFEAQLGRCRRGVGLLGVPAYTARAYVTGTWLRRD